MQNSDECLLQHLKDFQCSRVSKHFELTIAEQNCRIKVLKNENLRLQKLLDQFRSGVNELLTSCGKKRKTCENFSSTNSDFESSSVSKQLPNSSQSFSKNASMSTPLSKSSETFTTNSSQSRSESTIVKKPLQNSCNTFCGNGKSVSSKEDKEPKNSDGKIFVYYPDEDNSFDVHIWESIVRAFKNCSGGFITEKDILDEVGSFVAGGLMITDKTLDDYFQRYRNSEELPKKRFEVKTVYKMNKKGWLVLLSNWLRDEINVKK
jgi:hypothetical protein